MPAVSIVKNVRLLPIWMCLTGLFWWGCDGKPRPSYPPRKPTPGKANLPSAPDLTPQATVAQHPDGAWSVRGVTESATAGRGAESVQVRGYVARVHRCKADAKSCRPAPHLLLTDRRDLQGRRLLIGGVPTPAPGQGQLVTVTGRMVAHSPDGLYVAPKGLLWLTPPPEPEAK